MRRAEAEAAAARAEQLEKLLAWERVRGEGSTARTGGGSHLEAEVAGLRAENRALAAEAQSWRERAGQLQARAEREAVNVVEEFVAQIR